MADWDVVQESPVAAPATAVSLSVSPSGPSDMRSRMVKAWVDKTGVPEHVAQGIADRAIGAESGGKSNAIGDGGTSFGLYQEHGPRADRLKAWAGRSGKAWTDPDLQNDYAIWEATQGGDPTATKHWDEIKNAPDRATAKSLFTKYFERPATGGGWEVTGVGNRTVSPEAMAQAAKTPDSMLIWASPAEYKQMVQETDDETRPSSRSLDKSLNKGESVQSIPEVTVRNGKVIDQDGWRRAQALQDAGVTMMPVLVRGVSGDKAPAEITDMRGRTRPFDFVPVPTVAKPLAPLITARGEVPTYDTGEHNQGPSALGEIGQAAKDIANVPVGLAERAMLGAWNTGGLLAGNKPTPETLNAPTPIEPGLEKLGDIATFLTGGLMNPIGARAIGESGRAMTEARGTALAVLPAPMSPPVANFLSAVREGSKTENTAREMINSRFGQDLAAGGAAPAEIARQLEAGRGEGMTLADVAGENVRGLLGNVAREPGAGRNVVKQWAVNRLGDVDRDSPIATNIEKGIEANLATGSARTEARALAEQRAASKPLWEKAMAGGSVAPLERQFASDFAAADQVVADLTRNIQRIENEITQAAARQSQAGNAYATSAANQARKFADDKIAELRSRLDQAAADKAAALTRLRAAQADGTANAPGAVWSAYIGRLLTNPVVKTGVNRGYAIERNIADGENRPFNPREYAVVGHEANGEPIIGSVPNMKLLAVAKEGMDAMLESEAYKDPLTGRLNKAGRAIKILRDGLLNEIDRLNPDYKPARDAWAGDSALIGAIRDGKNFHKQSPEEIREWFASAAESEKDFYRLGAADTIRDDLQKRVFGGDPSKAIINSPRARNQLLPMFRSPEDASSFLARVKRARTMFQTPVDVLGNSKTAAREAEDLARRQGLDTAADLLHGIAGVASGHAGGLLYRAGRILNRHANPLSASPEREMAVNAAIARLLTDSNLRINVAPGQQLLRRLALPQTQNALVRLMLRGVPPPFRQAP